MFSLKAHFDGRAVVLDEPKLSAVALARMTEPPEPFLLKHLSLNKVRLLPISMGSIFVAGSLPQGAHKDPFDRLIAAQCLRHDLTLVSIDTALDAYGIRRIW
jgi:PIN domain nuclease of toxin-antitoxin system